MKGWIRTDFTNVQFAIIRLLLCLATLFKFRLGYLDIKGAYLQSGPITHKSFVRPSQKDPFQRNTLCRLTRSPYGIVEAGRQLAKRIEGWLERKGFCRVFRLAQIYISRYPYEDGEGKVKMIVVKLTDVLLFAGTIPAMERFLQTVRADFPVRKSIIDDETIFNGATIKKSCNGTIKFSMESYLSKLQPIKIDKSMKKDRTAHAPQKFQAQTRTRWENRLARLRRAFSSHLVGSNLQQKLPHLTYGDIIEANRMLKELKDLQATLKYIPTSHTGNLEVLTFSDAAFNISSSHSYGKAVLSLVSTLQELKAHRDTIL